MITLSTSQEGPHAVLLFTEKGVYPYAERIRKPPPRQARFAIILGGYTTGSSSAWASFIHILGEDTADENFRKLLDIDGESVKYCTTNKRIVSSIAEKGIEETLLRCRQSHVQRIIRRWEESWITSMAGGAYRAGDIVEDRIMKEIFVDVHLQKVPINLVEKGTAVHIEFSNKH